MWCFCVAKGITLIIRTRHSCEDHGSWNKHHLPRETIIKTAKPVSLQRTADPLLSGAERCRSSNAPPKATRGSKWDSSSDSSRGSAECPYSEPRQRPCACRGGGTNPVRQLTHGRSTSPVVHKVDVTRARCTTRCYNKPGGEWKKLQKTNVRNLPNRNA